MRDSETNETFLPDQTLLQIKSLEIRPLFRLKNAFKGLESLKLLNGRSG